MPTEPRNPKKHEAKHKFPEKVKYNRIALEATVVSMPDHQATVIRGKVRPEVTVRANLYNGNSSDTYTLRFIDEHFLPFAERLQPGCRIHIENGKFRKRHGRDSLESEFEVKRFTLIRGELKPLRSRVRKSGPRGKYALTWLHLVNTPGFKPGELKLQNLKHQQKQPPTKRRPHLTAKYIAWLSNALKRDHPVEFHVSILWRLPSSLTTE